MIEALTATGPEPAGTATGVVCEPYPADVPYWNVNVVEALCTSTLPVSVTVFCVTFVAGPVALTGH